MNRCLSIVRSLWSFVDFEICGEGREKVDCLFFPLKKIFLNIIASWLIESMSDQFPSEGRYSLNLSIWRALVDA